MKQSKMKASIILTFLILENSILCSLVNGKSKLGPNPNSSEFDLGRAGIDSGIEGKHSTSEKFISSPSHFRLERQTSRHGGGAITLDPVSIISLLALAFLINNILQLLRTNQMMPATASARARDKIGDGAGVLDFDDAEQYGRRMENGIIEPDFEKFFANLGPIYFLSGERRGYCMKRVVCIYNRKFGNYLGTFRSATFNIMLMGIMKLVAPDMRSRKERCQNYSRYCSNEMLWNAKKSAEKKVFRLMFNNPVWNLFEG